MNLIVGIREEAWPKGSGYLYFKRTADQREERLCDLNLYDLGESSTGALFRQALHDIISAVGCTPADIRSMNIQTENMSRLATELLHKQLRELVGSQ